jgi:ABC-type glycerol-3-phosphate transport system substrate-binding protein
MKLHRKRAVVAALAMTLMTGLAACSEDDGATNSDGEGTGSSDVTVITVMGMPAATNEQALKLFQDQVAAFEAENPDIRVVGADVPWDVKTFAPRLAGGSAPTLLRVPLTEPAALIDNGQVADISAEAHALDGYESLNPRVMEFLERDGATYGLPEKAYAFGLAYNRGLFTQAGLDPDKPPATWDEVRDYAKRISETGAVGFGEITTNNSGGWHLTAYVYSNGGSMIEQDADGTWSASFNDAQAKDVMAWWKALRWEDDSMGSNVLGKQEDMTADFLAGKVGMWVASPSDLYPGYMAAGGNPDDFGAGPMPQGGADATLAGATVLMVSATASDAERAAAVKWMEFRALQPNYDVDTAVATAEATAGDGGAVGVPVLPIFDQETYDTIQDAIAEYVNVPVENFAPYVESLDSFEYVAEPLVASQEIYAALDPVVQAVLTDKNADIDALLTDAEARVNTILEQNQE